MRNIFAKIGLLLLVAIPAVGCSPASSSSAPDGTVTITFNGVIDTDLEILFDSFKKDGVEEDYYNNRWLDLYREEAGVNVEYHWVAQGWDQKKQKLSLDLVSGDLADIITFDSIDMAMDAFEEGYTMDLTELFYNNASSLVLAQAQSPSSQIMMKSCTTDNGKLFAIPGFTHILNQSPLLYIRKDWLDKLSIPVPTSRAEVINIMKAFRDNDPDGNGKKDTYGIGLTGNFVQYQGEINGYTEMFGGYPYDWIENDGVINYGALEDGSKQGIAFLQELYKGDYIDKEFVTKDCNDLAEDIANGKIGLFTAPYWMIENALHTGWVRDNSMEWVYLPIYDGDGIASVNADSFARHYIAVRKGFEHPEKLIEMINLYHEVVFGENNQFEKYFMDEKYPNYWHLSPIQFVDSRTNGCTEYYRDFMAIENGTLAYENANYIAKIVYDIHQKVKEGKTYKNGGLTLAEWKRYNYYGPNSTSSVLAKYEDLSNYKISYVYVPTTRNSIGSLQIDTYINIITKGHNVDSAYSSFITNWKNRGGTNLISEYQAWYDARFK